MYLLNISDREYFCSCIIDNLYIILSIILKNPFDLMIFKEFRWCFYFGSFSLDNSWRKGEFISPFATIFI